MRYTLVGRVETSETIHAIPVNDRDCLFGGRETNHGIVT